MKLRPSLLTVFTFLALIVLGAVAFGAFGMNGAGRTGWVPAAFTAVSAVCVTGLGVVDLARETGTAGQVIVLVLLQLGGLGLLTFSNWILLSLRGRMSLYGSVLTRETMGGLPWASPARILRKVLVFTLVLEGAGTAVLYLRFAAGFPAGQALWLAAFHAISAFCNAGFSLFSDSLEGFRADPVVNLTVGFLVVAGGIGFVAALDLVDWTGARLRRVRRQLSFHTRTVLWTSGILVFGGATLFMALEWKNSFAGLPLRLDFMEALFLSVTARTAGFNTVPTGQLSNTTLLAVVFLMVVGASPGSTGGGIKTGTLAILWAQVRSILLNRPRAELGGRSIPSALAAKALALLALYLATATTAVLALEATEHGALPHAAVRGEFLEHLFEVVSALSTVGLSTGLTPRLSEAGLFILMACMFVGRVGPLVLASSLIGERRSLPFQRPEGDIMVG